MSKQVAFIIGAASGIGKQIGETLLKEDKTVVFSDIDEDALKEVVDEYTAQNLDADSIVCDVSDEDSINKTIDYTIENHGRLDILINNVGLQHVSNIEDFPTSKSEAMLKIMLTGAFIAIKRAFPIMKEQGYGRIINMASVNGVIGFAGKAAYNSAKHGLIGLTKVAAFEAEDSVVTVNAICPGYVDTPLVRGQFEDLAETRGIDVEDVLEEVLYPLVPQKRLIDVQEIADYVSFLVSDKAKGVTGQPVLLDGGYTAQ